MSLSFEAVHSTKLTTVAAHSAARGAKRRGEVRRIASPRRSRSSRTAPNSSQ